MFNNVGKGIKNYVKILTWIQVLMSVMIGIIVYILFATQRRGGLGFLIMLIVIGIGCYTAWLSGVIWYAYGEITEGVMAIRNKLCGETENNQNVANYSNGVVEVKNKQCDKIMNDHNNVKNSKTSFNTVNPGAAVVKTNWTCSSCGTVNPYWCGSCSKCSAEKNASV